MPIVYIFFPAVSAAMNELRPCAAFSLKHILAQELVKGLRAVSEILLSYNSTRMLRDNESTLFLALCQAYIEVTIMNILKTITHLTVTFNTLSPHPTNTHTNVQAVFPYCATCFGRCYPGGLELITECKNLFDGVNQLLTVSHGQGLKKLQQQQMSAPAATSAVVGETMRPSTTDGIIPDKNGSLKDGEETANTTELAEIHIERRGSI